MDWKLFSAGLLMLFLGACAAALRSMVPAPLEYEHQRAVIQIIWVEMYGRSEPAPQVEWKEADCTSTSGKRGIGPSSGGGCVAGVTPHAGLVLVAHWTGAKYHELGLAHELRHAAHFYDGIEDPDHLLPDWEPGGIVEQANMVLEFRGY